MTIREEVLKDQPASVLRAVEELESRGLAMFCHFGTDNARMILHEMNRAYDTGQLYEWMRDRFGP